MTIGDQPGLFTLAAQLVSDATGWAQAEIEVARADVRVIARRIAIGLILSAVSLGLIIAALVLLVQTAAAAIAPLVGGPVIAGLIVVVALVILVAVMLLIAKNMFVSHAPRSRMLQMATGAGRRGGSST